MEIRGSGNKYYEVNISELTCTCRDWTCRRHNFPKGDNKRLCKHLVEAIELDSLINSNSIKFPGVPKLTNYEKIRLLFIKDIELSSLDIAFDVGTYCTPE